MKRLFRELLEKLFKWLENYLYDDETRSDLERKCYRLESIIKKLQEKYDDDTYYMY